MATIVVPKPFVKIQNLIAVPHNLYEEFLNWQKELKSKNVFTPTKSEKIALKRARKNFKASNYISLEDLDHELGSTHR